MGNFFLAEMAVAIGIKKKKGWEKDTTTNLINASGFTATEHKGKFCVPSTETGE